MINYDLQNFSYPQNLNPLEIAFIQGAAWWEYEKESATMWPSDKEKAAKVAIKRNLAGKLGIWMENWIVQNNPKD